MDYRYIVEYANRNAIAPLDEFVGGALQLDDFDKDQLDGGKVDGKLYGISLGANSVAHDGQHRGLRGGRRATSRTASMTYDDLPAMGEAFNGANKRGGMKVDQDGSWPRADARELAAPARQGALHRRRQARL